ncbi:murein hydrolase activator EnvC family protein [Conexibacter arvalis]|uniref:Murein DD-endopeptidase MepM/ murein hydrolase activator NlpD n=1 Tax=Conexibacter arvalis TaxID=912552 RepID=A0A840IDZ4_9ACTN|nr:M23 family metallopeptidase [Conexibacter arvalis]MBB4662565.1 murein DD-endopeptidase MepM/ murein hydrolase activator NlpD [Conexibacter arvalis]
MRLRLLLACLLLPLVVWVSLPLVSSADPQSDLDRVEGKIDSKRNELNRVRGRAQVLTSDITAFTRRIDTLQGTVDRLQKRQDAIQSDLDEKRGELLRTQEELRTVRARLARLRVRLRDARDTLAARLVELYKSDEPDIVSVVLDSDGFAELLENGAYLQRIGEQDRRIITAVRSAKEEAATATRRLSALERRQQAITDTIYQRRNEVARARIAVEKKRDDVGRARAGKRELLRRVRQSASHIHEDIEALQAEQAKIERKIRAAQAPTTTATDPGPVRGGGRFIWPVNGPITSSFGWRTSPVTRFHQGLDIGAASGTPIRAGGGGTVIMAGYNGGYGNFTCIDHGGGISTCYAHQSSIGVSAGQSVSQGQVIGAVGNTGFSFGAHLHFEVRVNGSAVQPLNYLG